MTHENKNGHDHQLQTSEESNGAVTHAEPMESGAVQQRPERTASPRASVYDVGEEVVLELEMPGVSRDNIDIRVENDELTIYGKRRTFADEGREMLHQERPALNYRRTFILSDRIDSNNIKANCENGVLRLTLPKAAQAKPRRITIE